MDSTSISKKNKPSKENDYDGEDRISRLPDNIISQMLSLLPTVSAMSTSVLSTKWKDIWKTTTVLHLIDTSLPSHPTDNTLQQDFTRFVYWVLLTRGSSGLHKLYLKCGEGYDAIDVDAWIAHAVNCSIQELHVYVKMENSILLPKNLFSCQTLVKLKLGKRFVINVPASVSMPCLKVLEIRGAKLYDDNSISRLISGCPALEQLSMKNCIGTKVRVVRICAPLLTSLIIDELPYHDDYYKVVFEYQIQVETPKLSYLYFDDYIAEGYAFGDLAYLAKAHVGIMRLSHDGDCFPRDEKYLRAVDHLFEAISGVQHLHLTGNSIEAIQENNDELPQFAKMTDLCLGADYREEAGSWNWFISLLENSPQLRSITFQDGLNPTGDAYEFDLPKTGLPDCLTFSLKKIVINEFMGQACEIPMVAFFLEHAKVLEQLDIYYAGDEDGYLHAAHHLFRLPRSSKGRRLQFRFFLKPN